MFIINSYRRSDPYNLDLNHRLILGIEHGPIAEEHMTKVERHQCLSSRAVCQSPFLSAVQIRPWVLSGFCWLALWLGIIPPRPAHDCVNWVEKNDATHHASNGEGIGEITSSAPSTPHKSTTAFSQDLLCYIRFLTALLFPRLIP